jgi:hypothetical protein
VTSLLVIFNEIDNMKNFHHVISLSSIFLLLSCSPLNPTPPKNGTPIDKTVISAKAGAPLFDGMGQHQHPITTHVPALDLNRNERNVRCYD